MRTSYLKTLLLTTAVSLCVATAEAETPVVRLWAVSDGVRVSPTTGKLIEDRRDIHKDYPTGDYRAGNSVWDASTNNSWTVGLS